MPFRFRVPVRFPDPLAGDEDRDLVRRFADAHDEAAFSGLVHRHARMVFGVCQRTVGDQHLAEDAFQAVFLVLARNPRQAVAASSVGGWLFGIARRVGLTAYRIVYWHESGLRGGKNGRFGEPITIFGPTMEIKPIDFDVTAKMAPN